VPERFRTVYLLNPVAAVLALYHQILYEGRWPSAVLFASSAALATVVCVIGVGVFRRQRALFAEII
jgi:ABC-type polysaccharide/polyol phosphate export permease